MNKDGLDALSQRLWRDMAREFPSDPKDGCHPRTDPVHPMFRDHNCWRCQHGTLDCVVGEPRRCQYPRARND